MKSANIMDVAESSLGNFQYINYCRWSGIMRRNYIYIYHIEEKWLLCLPPVRVGRHIVFPLASVCLYVCGSVGLSVCLSVTKSCPLYNLITVTDISTKLHTFVKHIETTCHAQEP